MANPVALKKACRWSTPSSMIPIFTPAPAVSRLGPQSCGAPICGTLWSRLDVYVADA
jgi:hypothetical protein